MRALKLAAAVCGLAVAAACGGSEPSDSGDQGGESGEAIKIGSIHPLTGALAGEGAQMQAAVELAVEDINADGGIGSLGGAQLEVLSADSQGAPEVGQSEAQRLIQEGAVALVGTYQSAVTTNVAAVAERNKVPLVIDVAVADSILQQGYEYTFRIQPNATAMGRQGAQFLQEVANELGVEVTKVAYLHEQTDFGTSVYTAFNETAEGLGWAVDPVITYDAFNVSDLTTEMTRVKAAGADVLVVTGYYNDGVLAAQAVQAVDPGVQIVYGVADGAFDVPQFPGDASGAGDGFFDANYHLDATNPDTQDVMSRFEEKTGQEMRTAAVLSYEAVRVVAAGLEKASSADSNALRDAIAGLSMDSLLALAGPIEFTDTGENANAIPIVMQVQGDNVVQVWPEQFSEAEIQTP